MTFRVVQHEVKQNAVYIENLSKLSFLHENQVWRFRSAGLVSLSVLGTEVRRISKKLATIGNRCMFRWRKDVR